MPLPLSSSDGPPRAVRVPVEGRRGGEVRLLEVRGGFREEQLLRPLRGVQGGLGRLRPSHSRAPDRAPFAVEDPYDDPVEPGVQVAVAAVPERDALDGHVRPEVDLPPGVRLGTRVGDRAIRVDAARVAVDRQLGRAVVAGARLRGRPGLGHVHAAREDLHLGQAEDAARSRQLEAHQPARGRGPVRVGRPLEGQVGDHEVAVARAAARAVAGQVRVRVGSELEAAPGARRQLEGDRVGVALRRFPAGGHDVVDHAELRTGGGAGVRHLQALPARLTFPGARDPARHSFRIEGLGELRLDPGALVLQPLELGELVARRRAQPRSVVVLVRVDGLVEEGEQAVVLLDLDRVVLVGVALGAAVGQPHPGLHRRVGAVLDRLHAPLLVVGTALGVRLRVAVERGREALLEGRVGQQITGQLVAGELVVGLVGVERVDDPVAITPDRAQRVRAEAGRVRVAGHVEPDPRPAFAVVRTGQQAVHVALVGIGRGIGLEGLDLLGGRRQTDQVERDAPRQLRAGRRLRRRQPLGVESRQQERVDRVAHPARVAHLRLRGPLGDHEGPVLGVGRTVRDPAAQELDLMVGQPLGRLLGRHALPLVGRADALEQQAAVGIARHDGRERALAGIEA